MGDSKFMHNLPLVTVIMPVRNEAAFIDQSLGAVLTQDYSPERMEVLVVDGRSTDATRERVAELAKRRPEVALSVIDNPRGIVATGLNAGLARAQGEIIVRVDGHTIIAPDYVRQSVAAIERTKADNVGGRMAAVGGGRLGQAVALATSSRFGVGNARFHYSDEEEWVDTVYLGSWPRGVFQRVGLFDEEQVRNQDDEFNYRLRARGGRILLCPLIKSQYHNRATLGSLWRQYLQYGYWKVRVMQKHLRQMRLRQFAPALFVSALVASLLAAPWSIAGRWALGGLLATYMAANLAASIMVAAKGGWRMLPLLPVVFATLHVAYGVGFLGGLIRFWNRWGRLG